MESLIAWAVLPAVLLVLSFGLGRLVERLTGLELAPALVAPVGAALAIALALTGYVVGLGGLATPILMALLAVAGLVPALSGRRLPRPGLAALLWAAVYGLYLAPVVLSGHWTWTGYNFVNDTSVQLLLADWLPDQGRQPPPEPFVSTTLDVLRSYLYGGYPLGSHALLAAVHQLVPIPLEALYQPFIAAFAGLGAISLMVLVQRVVGVRWAAFAAFCAMATNLLYQYSLQGNMKEIVTASMLAATASVAGWSLALLRDSAPADRRRILIRSAIVLAVPVSAVIDVISTAGAPYVALIVLLWAGLLLAHRVVPGPVAFLAAAAAGTAVVLIGSLSTVSKLIVFGRTASATYADPARASDLGHLAGPLDVLQTAGVWLIGDYRYVPAGINGTLTTAGIWLVLILAVVGVAYLLWRRKVEALLFCLPVIIVMLVVTPRVSPYADAKTYMLMAPAVTLLGALGVAAVGRMRAWAGGVLAVGLLGAVMTSNALAYHDVQLAPVERMEALRDLERHVAGDGMVLFNEPDEFAKNFLDDTQLNVGAENVTPKQSQLRVPQAFSYLYFDLDELTSEYVQQFPVIVVRRSPVASRPPANYRLTYSNDYYEAWRRAESPRVLEHLPLQALQRVSLEPDCGEVMAMARRARPGDALVGARAAETVRLDTVTAPRTNSWVVHPYRPGMVLTGGPGRATAKASFPASDTYRVWVAGSFGRPVEASLDGRPLGTAGGVNNVGQWHEIGTTHVERGTHRLSLTRPGGDLSPGDGFAGALGPLVFERVVSEPLVEFNADEARDMCGRAWDWVELVRSGDGAGASGTVD